MIVLIVLVTVGFSLFYIPFGFVLGIPVLFIAFVWYLCYVPDYKPPRDHAQYFPSKSDFDQTRLSAAQIQELKARCEVIEF